MVHDRADVTVGFEFEENRPLLAIPERLQEVGNVHSVVFSRIAANP